MKRSLGIFIAGVAIGLLLAFAIIGRGRNATHSKGVSAATDKNSQAAATVRSPSDKLNFEDDKILLGNITAVPFQELYGVLSRRTPAEIAQLAQQLDSLPSGKDSAEKITAFFKAWSHLDSASAFKAATSLKTAEARETATSATIVGADQAASGSLAHALSDLPANMLPGSTKAGLLGMLLEKWGESDAPAAAKFLDDSSVKGMSSTLAGHGIAQSWAAIDPVAAMAWANQHQAGPLGVSALSGAISGWWQKDHAAAEAYAASQVNSPQAMQLIAGLISPMVRDNPQRALAWLNQLPNAEVRKQAVNMLAGTWAVNDPQAASEWAATLPNDQSSSVLNSTMSFWAQTDPQAASQWVGNLTGTTRDNAIGAFSSGIVDTDPATALNWVESINDSTIREQALRRVVGRWLSRDPAAAKSWIQNSFLPDAQKTQLLAATPGG